MVQRRPLVEGLKGPAIDPAVEKDFVFQGKVDPRLKDKQSSTVPSEIRDSKTQPPISRVPLTTRVRTEFATALKRESLERQLNGLFPNSLQEILEEALEPWMREKGHLK
jgi:hypothetical protein